MTVSAEDVRTTVFRIALRGYAVDEVDAFLDRLESELTARESGVTVAPDVRGTDDASDTGTDAPVQGVRLLQLAESTAERLVAEARAEASGLVEAAQAAARQLTGQAESEAARTRSTAAAEADQLRAAARADADRLEREHAQRQQRETAQLERRVHELRTELHRLERLEQVHREQMVAALTRQLQAVQEVRPAAA